MLGRNMVIASTRGKVIIGVNATPSELHSFLLDMPSFNASLKITGSDSNEFQFRLTWSRGHDYCFELSILQEGDLCDLHVRPASDADSMVISSATASIIEAMSLRGFQIGELRDYTQEKMGRTKRKIRRGSRHTSSSTCWQTSIRSPATSIWTPRLHR